MKNIGDFCLVDGRTATDHQTLFFVTLYYVFKERRHMVLVMVVPVMHEARGRLLVVMLLVM